MHMSKPGNRCYAYCGLAVSLGLSMAFALYSEHGRAQSAPAAPPGARPLQAPPPARLPGRGGSDADGSGQVEDKVRVKSITISGNQAVQAGELQQLVAGMVGAEHSLGQLNATARRITAYYRERGFAAARAYLAQQDISDGAINILVTEGRAPNPAEPAAEPRPGDRGLMLLHLLRSQR